MFRRLRQVTHIIAGTVRKVLAFLLLVVVYFIVIGVTSLVLRIFRRDLFAVKFTDQNVCWGNASGYKEEDEEGYLRQA
jgi:hypothetical protein